MIDRSRPSGDLATVTEELGRLLAVLGAQLVESVEAAGHECAALGTAFDELGAASRRIEAIAAGSSDGDALRAHCARINGALGAAVVAMQYQDRLAQRIGHIRNGLDELQKLLRDGRGRTCADWLSLLRAVEHDHEAEQARLAAVGAALHGSAELF